MLEYLLYVCRHHKPTLEIRKGYCYFVIFFLIFSFFTLFFLGFMNKYYLYYWDISYESHPYYDFHKIFQHFFYILLFSGLLLAISIYSSKTIPFPNFLCSKVKMYQSINIFSKPSPMACPYKSSEND